MRHAFYNALGKQKLFKNVRRKMQILVIIGCESLINLDTRYYIPSNFEW